MDKYAIPNKLPAKQVSILAHRRGRIRKDEAEQKNKFNRKNKIDPNGFFHNPEHFIVKYRKAERDDKRVKRHLINNGINPSHFKPDDHHKMAFVVRFRGQRVESKQVLKCLQRLRLHHYQDAAFVRLNDETKALLAAVDPYVIWGYPNVHTVRELILKYGFQSVGHKKVPISSNKQVEDALGECEIICIEDLVLELFKCGKNFEKANKFLHQFKLKSPQEGFEKTKGKHFIKQGEYGFRGEKINEYLKQVM